MKDSRSSRFASRFLRHAAFSVLGLGVLATTASASDSSASASKIKTTPSPTPSADATGLRFCIASQHSRCFTITAATGAAASTDKTTSFEVEQLLNGTLISKKVIDVKERARLIKATRNLLVWAEKSEIKIVGKKGELELPCSIHLTLEKIGASAPHDALKVCRDHLPKEAGAKIKTLIAELSPQPRESSKPQISLKSKTKKPVAPSKKNGKN